jgi:hypothetical protein
VRGIVAEYRREVPPFAAVAAERCLESLHDSAKVS